MYIYILYMYIYIYIYNIYIRTEAHCTKQGKQSSVFKMAFRNSVPCHEEVHWLHHKCYIVEHKVCSVTSEPTQSSSRCVSSLKNPSVLLTTEWSPNH